MKQYGVTQDAIAASCGVHRTMVNKVINGRAVSSKVLGATDRLILAARIQRREATD